MDWVTFGAQWLHVLLGISWFGYSISMYYLVGPAISNMSVDAQREANSHLGRLAARVFPVVGSLVLLLGVVMNGMNLLGFNTFIQRVALGLLLVAAVAVSQWRQARAERTRTRIAAQG